MEQIGHDPIRGMEKSLWAPKRMFSQPAKRIEFCCFVAEYFVMRLKLTLVPESEGTRLTWARRWLSLGPQGDAWLAKQSSEALDRMVELRRAELVHFLATGEMLKT